ncbi:MAG: hypothetical protein MH132_07515 [Hydrotalea sp.]|nr:hypothetical protein [Hydrotalea sp.]
MTNFLLLKSEKEKIKLFLLLYACIMFCTMLVANGTGDEGDSVYHFLFAKYAGQYPAHFFDHWAKPLYVLCAFPFAQIGFTGVKLMNIGWSTLSVWRSYQIAQHAKIANAWMAPLLLCSMPMFNSLTLSGLTEPMFAACLSSALYFLLKEKWKPAILLLSFLPFIRSEGLLVVGWVMLYLLWEKQYRLLPLLLVGHITYALAGSWVHGDVSWVFTKMSYATWDSAYGKGTWLHFIERLPEIVGSPLAMLFYGGLLLLVVQVWKFIFREHTRQEGIFVWLIWGTSFLYFFAHTAFWALGIFNSFGMLRVMVGIAPLLAVVLLQQIQFLFEWIEQPKIKQWCLYILFAGIAIYPFTGHTYAYAWKRDFMLRADQQAQSSIPKWLKENRPDYAKRRFFYEASYLSVLLQHDWWNPNQHRRIRGAFEVNDFKKGDMLIWDDWFAVVEGLCEWEPLEKDKRFQLLYTTSEKDPWNNIRTTKVLEFMGDGN